MGDFAVKLDSDMQAAEACVLSVAALGAGTGGKYSLSESSSLGSDAEELSLGSDASFLALMG
eukprot:IDg22939t1